MTNQAQIIHELPVPQSLQDLRAACGLPAVTVRHGDEVHQFAYTTQPEYVTCVGCLAVREVRAAREALGAGWLAGGVSLAEGIERKTRALERSIEAQARMLEARDRADAGETEADTRDWYWRASDGDTRPEGPYPTREAALADVLGYYAVGELPDGVYVGRCTDPMTLAGACAETICENIEEQLAEQLHEVRVELVDAGAAQEALDEWVRQHVMVTDPAWTTDPEEEWVEMSEPEEGGTP